VRAVDSHREGRRREPKASDRFPSHLEELMSKLTLKVENLAVESFDTGDEQRRRGTVRGHDTVETEWCTGYPECISKHCQTPYDTCYGTCGCTENCASSPPEC
jgi:hypothetical protein